MFALTTTVSMPHIAHDTYHASQLLLFCLYAIGNNDHKSTLTKVIGVHILCVIKGKIFTLPVYLFIAHILWTPITLVKLDCDYHLWHITKLNLAVLILVYIDINNST